MNLSVAFVLLAALPSLAAQRYAYSPPGHGALKEGTGFSTTFGSYPNQRVQTVDGHAPVGTLTEISFRRERRHAAVGRKWSNVTLTLGSGDLNTFGRTFTQNMTSTPTTVFQGSFDWPSTEREYVGFHLSWRKQYSCPFRLPYVHFSGDLVQSWEFTSGTLANGGNWNTHEQYFFDGWAEGLALSDGEPIPRDRLNNNSKGVTGRCNDSANQHREGAAAFGEAMLWGDFNYLQPSRRGQLDVELSSMNTAPGAPVLFGLAGANDKQGIDLGTGCNRLHLAGPLAVAATRADASAIAQWGVQLKWTPTLALREITVQAAWTDSQTSNLNLSQAFAMVLPGSKPLANVQRLTTYNHDLSSPMGHFPTQGSTVSPAMRYTVR